MMCVDAYLLYKACCGQRAKMNPKQFFEKLAEELIDFGNNTEGTKTRSSRGTKRERAMAMNEGVAHRRTSRKKPRTNNSKQGRCKTCNSHTTFICSRCTATHPKNKDVYVCKSKSGECWAQHLRCAHNL